MPGTTVSNSPSPKHLTTTAGQVDTITFGSNVSEVVVVMKVPAATSTGLYVTADGVTAPAANADSADWVPPVAGSFVRIPLASTDTVKVFSATADDYMVRGV